MKKMIIISIVLAVKNESGYIEKCLESCYNQTLNKELYEVIVIDGKSSDNTVSIVKEFELKYPDFNIRIFQNPKEIQASGWNIGIKKSKSDFVVILGGHTVIAPDFLEKNLELHQKYDVPCTGGVVTAIGLDRKSISIGMAFNSTLGAGNAKYWYGDKEEFVETVAFGMYKRFVFEGVGYFDEKIVRGQDWDLNYRITQKFGKLLFSPKIKSYYYARTSFKKLWKRQFDAGKWKVYIIKKFPQSILARHLIPPLFSLGIILTLFFSIYFNKIYISLFYIILYFLLILITIIKNSKQKVNFIYLFITYFIIHFGYGIGFLYGIIKFHKNSNSQLK